MRAALCIALGCVVAVAACKSKDDAGSAKTTKTETGPKQPGAETRPTDKAVEPPPADKPKHTLEQITGKLDNMRKQLDIEGLFEFSSKAYRAQLDKQAKAILAGIPAKQMVDVLGVSKAEADKLNAKQLLMQLKKLAAFRKMYEGAPHKFVRADYETKTRANVLTLQEGVKCRRRFVVEDGDWRLDRGAMCEQASLSAADKVLFPKLVGLMKSLVVSGEKHAKNCDAIATAWQKILAASAALVKQRKQLMLNVRRYKLFSKLHAKENGALTKRLLPVLKKCGRNASMRRVLGALL